MQRQTISLLPADAAFAERNRENSRNSLLILQKSRKFHPSGEFGRRRVRNRSEFQEFCYRNPRPPLPPLLAAPPRRRPCSRPASPPPVGKFPEFPEFPARPRKVTLTRTAKPRGGQHRAPHLPIPTYRHLASQLRRCNKHLLEGSEVSQCKE